MKKIDNSNNRRKKNDSPIGYLCSGKNTLHGIIDIALIQSCQEGNEIKPFVRDYGMVIVDECHHVSSVSFEQVLKQVRAHYVYGLTATPIRKDGHQPPDFVNAPPKLRFAVRQVKKWLYSQVLLCQKEGFCECCTVFG